MLKYSDENAVAAKSKNKTVPKEPIADCSHTAILNPYLPAIKSNSLLFNNKKPQVAGTQNSKKTDIAAKRGQLKNLTLNNKTKPTKKETNEKISEATPNVL